MRTRDLIIGVVALMATSGAFAQSQTLAASIDVYVFPKEGQTESDQSKAEADCYSWATQNTGSDPFDLEKQQAYNQQQAAAAQQQAQQAGQGMGAQGALRGAAAGALIGEIANDDAGGGAAWGAAAGLIRGRRQARQQQQQAEAQVDQYEAQTQQATATQIQNFKKAFSVCLEGKDYLVKY